MKKSLAELEEIRKKTLENVSLRQGRDGYRISVGMATCGIAAGARPVLTTIMDEVAKQNLTDVTVSQTGCIGLCMLEPIVEITDKEGQKFTYVKVNEEKAKKLIDEHVVKGNPIKEYMMTVVDGTIVAPKAKE